MRKVFYLFLIIFAAASCTSTKKHNFSITGIIRGVDSGRVFLVRYIDKESAKTDSAVIKDGKFVIEGNISTPEARYLIVEGYPDKFLFFVDKSRIQIRARIDSFDQALVTGSAAEDEYKSFLKLNQPFEEQLYNCNILYTNALDSNKIPLADIYKTRLDSIDKQFTGFKRNYVLQHPKSFVSPYIVFSEFYNYTLDDLKKFLAAFDPSITGSAYINSIRDRIGVLETVAIGKPAPDFTQADTNGVPLSLSSFKGKYILVDFWASWCPDCVKENPNLVKIYRDFHPKGLEILGVSLDNNKTKWEKGITAGKLTWHHVSDLRKWNNEAGQLYGVISIPSNFLVNPKGIIIAENLYGNDLRKKIEEIFKSL